MSEGYITLSWNNSARQLSPLILELGTFEDGQKPRLIALREQNQVHLSGLSDGRYKARLKDVVGNAVSSQISFEVRHRDLGTAWTLFGIGMALFVFLVGLVVRFNKNRH